MQYIEFARSCRPDKAFTPHPAMNKAHFVDKLNAGFNPDIIFIQPQNSLQHTLE